MLARFDDQAVPLTPRFVGALLELLKAECDMMEQQPGHEDSWWWGRCRILDLAHSRGLELTFGAKNDLPDDGHGRFAVVPVDEVARRGQTREFVL
jgi:hypothetical protein